MRNEEGYTLIIVMAIITITFILALSLSGMAMNSRMQIHKTDQINKATDLAEMGITFYHKKVSQAIQTSNTEPAQFKNRLETLLKSRTHFKVDVEQNQSYEVTFKELRAKQGSQNALEILFASKGSSSGEDRLIEVALTVAQPNNRAGETAPSRADFAVVESSEVDAKGNDKEETYDSSVFFNNTVTISGNKSSLKVEGDAFFTKTVKMNGNPSALFIDGDAFFISPTILDLNGNAPYICIKGGTYIVDSYNKLTFFELKENQCSNQSSKWSIDQQNGIKVEY